MTEASTLMMTADFAILGNANSADIVQTHQWGALAIGLVVIVGSIVVIIVAIRKYTAEELVKPLSAITGILGGAVGATTTYFFNAKSFEALTAEVQKAEMRVESSKAEFKETFMEDFNDLKDAFLALQNEVNGSKTKPNG
jgi:hypothetical protein